jgi:hypothetical protein
MIRIHIFLSLASGSAKWSLSFILYNLNFVCVCFCDHGNELSGSVKTRITRTAEQLLASQGGLYTVSCTSIASPPTCATCPAPSSWIGPCVVPRVLCNCLVGETESIWYCGNCLAYCTSPGWQVMSANANWQGKPKYSEKTSSSATLSITNPTWPDPGSNTGRRCEKPATNRLTYGRASGTLTFFFLSTSAVL